MTNSVSNLYPKLWLHFVEATKTYERKRVVKTEEHPKKELHLAGHKRPDYSKEFCWPDLYGSCKSCAIIFGYEDSSSIPGGNSSTPL